MESRREGSHRAAVHRGRLACAAIDATEPMVLVERVTHGERGPGLPILEDVSLAAAPGAFVVVEGRSGSGKSTLCQLVAGLEAPDRGLVLVGG